MSQDKRSIRTESNSDVIVQLTDGAAQVNKAGVNASGNLTVKVNEALPAGTNNIGDVDVLTMPGTAADGAALPAVVYAVGGTDGTNLQALKTDASGELQVDVLSSALPTGAATLAEQQTQTTALQLIDDSVATLGTTTFTEATTKAITIGALRRDADTSAVSATNEIAPLIVDANGYLKVEIFDGGDSHTVDATNLDIRDLVFATDKVDVSGSTVTVNEPVSVDDNGGSLTVDQPTHNNFNANANLQVADVDVSSSNPVPVTIVEAGSTTAVGEYLASAALAAQASETLSFALIPNTKTGRLQQVVVSAEVAWMATIIKYNGATDTTLGVIYGDAGDTVSFQPVNSAATFFSQSSTGTSRFKVTVKNNNTSGIGSSAAISVTAEWDEV